MSKSLIVILLVFCAEVATCQSQKQMSIDQVAHTAPHGLMSMFTNTTQDYSTNFQIWLQTKFNCSERQDLEPKVAPPNQMIMYYSKHYIGSEEKLPIVVHYYFNAKNDTVNKVTITGDWVDVLDLFIKYWDRPLRFDNKQRGEITWFYFLTDRVSFKSIDANKSAIIITPNGLIKQTPVKEQVYSK